MSETPTVYTLPPLPPEPPTGPKAFKLVLKATAPLPPLPAELLVSVVMPENTSPVGRAAKPRVASPLFVNAPLVVSGPETVKLDLSLEPAVPFVMPSLIVTYICVVGSPQNHPNKIK